MIHQILITSINPQFRKLPEPMWVFGVLLFTFAILVWIIAYNKRRWLELFEQFSSVKSANNFFKDDAVASTRTNLVLLIVFVLLSALFVAKSVFLLTPQSQEDFLMWVGIIALSVVIIYVIKILFVFLLGSLFKAERESREYVFLILLFNRFTGVVLLPVTILLFYLPATQQSSLIYIGFAFLALMFGIRLVRMCLIGIRSNFSYFYIFLYICAFEILPIMVFQKIVLKFNYDLV